MQNHRNGFSLIEMMIVIVIIGILTVISLFAWQQYVLNTHLRTAARNIVTDFQNCKAKASAESRNYKITFAEGTSNYTITAPATTTTPIKPAVNIPKSVIEEAGGIQITEASYGSGNTITFESRGTTSWGHVLLSSTNDSSARITSNSTGKVYVTFDMR